MNENFLTVATKLAHQAGDIMLENFAIGIKKEYKSDNTPLTIADTKINDLVIETIKKTYPEHSIIGEEGSHIVPDSEYSWICDPIDGTIPFSHGLPIFVFSLALTKNGESILGVVFDPILKRMFVAEKNKGAFMNDEPIHVSDNKDFNHSLVDVVSWNAAPYDLSALTNVFEKNDAYAIRLKCYVYAAMLVACGQASAALFAGKTPWDVAAVKIIIEEAGGKVTDLFGNDQRYDMPVKGLIASNGIIHDKTLKIIKENIK